MIITLSELWLMMKEDEDDMTMNRERKSKRDNEPNKRIDKIV